MLLTVLPPVPATGLVLALRVRESQLSCGCGGPDTGLVSRWGILGP